MSIAQRKNEHMEINLQKDVNSGITTGLERFHFVHQSLPEIDIKDYRYQCGIPRKKIIYSFNDFIDDRGNRYCICDE